MSSLVFDSNTSSVFAVASGKKLPVDVENAPSGVCVSLALQSVDASLISFNSDCKRNWASSVSKLLYVTLLVRIGSSSNIDAFNDIKLLDDGRKAIAATTTKGMRTITVNCLILQISLFTPVERAIHHLKQRQQTLLESCWFTLPLGT